MAITDSSCILRWCIVRIYVYQSAAADVNTALMLPQKSAQLLHKFSVQTYAKPHVCLNRIDTLLTHESKDSWTEILYMNSKKNKCKCVSAYLASLKLAINCQY